MGVATVLHRGPLAVIDYRCEAAQGEEPFVELHQAYSVSYVRRGTFGNRTCGESHELVAGSVLVNRPGDEYICTHDHAGGDECLSLQLGPELVEAIGRAPGRGRMWRTGALPPLPELVVLGELAQAAAECDRKIFQDRLAALAQHRLFSRRVP